VRKRSETGITPDGLDTPIAAHPEKMTAAATQIGFHNDEVSAAPPRSNNSRPTTAAGSANPPSGESTSTPAVPTPSAVTVGVVNAVGTSDLASEVSNMFSRNGYRAGKVRNPVAGESLSTGVDYGAGVDGAANSVATMLGIATAAQPNPDVAPGHIHVVLDDGFAMPADLGPVATAPAAGE
jgi:hypothetical protein